MPDPTFPAPSPPKEIVVPAEKPNNSSQPFFVALNKSKADGAASAAAGSGNRQVVKANAQDADPAAKAVAEPLEDRRQILKEVREHLELLKEFEGVISQEDLNSRKRDLFMALPPAPPPARSRRKESLPIPSKKPRAEDDENA